MLMPAVAVLLLWLNFQKHIIFVNSTAMRVIFGMVCVVWIVSIKFLELACFIEIKIFH